MQSATLDSAKAYFEQVVKPNFDEFISTPSSFRTAFNAAATLFHMYEWVYEFKQQEIEAKYAQPFATSGAFWRLVETRVPEAKFIRDLANASKHVRLTLSPSTSMTHIANTKIQLVAFGEGAYGQGRYGGGSVTMEDGGREVSLDQCVVPLFAYWQTLLAELYP